MIIESINKSTINLFCVYFGLLIFVLYCNFLSIAQQQVTMFDWLTDLFAQKQKVDWKPIYQGPNDLPSLNQMVQKHINMLDNKKQGKYLQTSDQKTLDIVKKMFENNPFVQQNILGCPSNDIYETESFRVKICNINKYPQIKKAYEQWKSTGQKRLIAIGGPSAHDQTLLSMLIPSIRQSHDVHFYCRNYLQSNVWHSALQSHARHGNALNADPILSGRHLLPLVFKRLFFGVHFNEVVERDFIKIDVKLNNFAYIIEYVKNEFNGLKQLFLAWRGKFNQHDLNRFQSVVSQQMQKIMQKATNTSWTSRMISKRDNEAMAIHLVFTQNQLRDMHLEHAQHKKVEGIKIQQVPQSQLQQLFPQSQKILAGFRYIGDYATRLGIYDVQKQKAKQMGATWVENKTLSKVFVDQNQTGPYACGIQFMDGQFVPADKIHLTLGYRAGFFFEDTGKRAVKNINIPVAGVSTNLLLKNTPNLKKIINEHGSLQLQITSNNWTIAGNNDDYVLLRGTAGGNTGSEAYQPSHFLNLMRNTRSIFGDAFVGIISVYGCPRAVNYKNSTEFCQLANGLVISYGKGGTGNTKRTAQAYKALKYLGFERDLERYFGEFKDSRVKIVQGMKKILRKSQQVGFFYDWRQQTKRNLFNNTV